MSRRTPTPQEIARFARTAADTMLDTCIVFRFDASTQDLHGIPTTTYVPGLPTRCGYSLRTRREVLGVTQVPIAVSVLRLPLSQAVTTLDRVQLTHRLGVPLTPPIVYEITDLRPGVGQQLLDITQAGDPGNVRA